METCIEVVAASGFYYNATKGIKQHKHPIFQLFFIVSGKGTFWSEDKKAVLKEGDFFLAAPNVMHSFAPPSIKTVMLDIKFLIRDPIFESEVLKLPACCKDNGAEILALFETIVAEAKEKRPYFNRLIALYLEAIFTIRLRMLYDVSDNSVQASTIYEQLGIKYDDLSICTKSAIAQIDGIISFPIASFSLDFLAETIGYSKRYLSSTFSKEVGCSIKQFVTMLRMDKAKEMLASSSLSIKEITAMLDFRSVSYFSTTFSKLFGVSPIAYREANRHKAVETLRYSFHDEFGDEKRLLSK